MTVATTSGRAGIPWVRGDPIVVFGDDWGRSISTMQHIFRHIALGCPVVWVNAIGHRPPSLTGADLRRAWEKLRAMAMPRPPRAGWALAEGGTPAAIIEPRVLPWHHVRLIHSLNTEFLVHSIRQALARLQLTRPPVLVTGSPPSVGVLGRLGEAAAIYFCMDDFMHFPGVSARMVGPLEQRLLARADALVATAESLTRSKLPASGRTYHLPQGVNYEHFARPQAEPDDMRAIPRPRLGFAGTVGGCLDLGLVRRLALTYPQCSVVLVGTVTADRRAMAHLNNPNVFVLGQRPYVQLPAYVQHFDVGVIPYTLSDYTRAVDPLKLLEYLAAGIPVVASAIPEIRKYSDVVTMAPDAETFVRAVGTAVTERGALREQRQRLASQHTWSNRAERLLEIIEEVVAVRSGARRCDPDHARATANLHAC